MTFIFRIWAASCLWFNDDVRRCTLVEMALGSELALAFASASASTTAVVALATSFLLFLVEIP